MSIKSNKCTLFPLSHQMLYQINIRFKKYNVSKKRRHQQASTPDPLHLHFILPVYTNYKQFFYSSYYQIKSETLSMSKFTF